jgi:hypothetical protein
MLDYVKKNKSINIISKMVKIYKYYLPSLLKSSIIGLYEKTTRWAMYEYRIYGLKVSSELKIEEALSGKTGVFQNENTPKEITPIENISMVNTPKDNTPKDNTPIENTSDVKITYCYEEEEVILRKAHQLKYNLLLFNFYIKDVGIYHVKEGKEISLELMKSANKQDITCYLLGTAFGFLLIQREVVAVHGSCVSIDNFGIIISGDSGAGKSTIATKLFRKGFDFIADDVCALTIQSDDIMVQLAYPQQKLCKDAAISEGYPLDSLIYLDEERDKYAIRLHNTNRFQLETHLGFMVVLNRSKDVSNVSVRLLSSYEKLNIFLHNIFRYELLQTLGINPSFMKNIIDIVNGIQIYYLVRPDGLETQEEVTDYIMQIIEKSR